MPISFAKLACWDYLAVKEFR